MSIIRVRFKKEGSAKYISHLDLIRAMQRSIRRADIPIGYTQGFNPHSKISYGHALSVGMSSDGEYLDMELVEEMNETEIAERLNRSLPKGISVTATGFVPDKSPSLASVINAAGYLITGRIQSQDTDYKNKVLDFFSSTSVLIERTNKRGKKKQVDIIPMILDVKRVQVEQDMLALEVMLAVGSKANLKPAHLIEAMERRTGVFLQETRIHRTGLFIKKGEKYFSPLEVFD